MLRFPLGGVAALVALGLSTGAQAQSSVSEPAPAETFDCRELATGGNDDVAPRALFLRSLWASHCYNFSARAVRISFDGVRTLALTHGVESGIETETARFLDGPPIAMEKRGKVGQSADTAAMGFSAGIAPGALTRKIVDHYELQPLALERIAGRSAWRLDIEPQDDLRYGYRLWLDRETSLPLKREMIGVDGRIIETFQITDLREPTRYAGTLELGPGQPPEDLPWQARWLPDGFTAQPIPPDTPGRRARVGHRLYSDGLSSISLFVEPITDNRRPLLAGIHRLGISYAVVRHTTHQGRPMQILVLGEAPAEVLTRIASGVTWGSDAADAESPSDRSKAGS